MYNKYLLIYLFQATQTQDTSYDFKVDLDYVSKLNTYLL